MSATAPGGGGSASGGRPPTGRPASARSSARRAPGRTRARSAGRPPAQRSTASSSRPAAQPAGRGSRQPNGSPSSARRRRSPSAASDSQVSSSVRAAEQAGLPVARAAGTSTASPSAGRRPRSRSARRSSAWRHRNSAGLGDVAGLVEDEQRARIEMVEPGRRGEHAGPDLGGVADVERPGLAGGRAAVAPGRRRTSPSNRARSAARRSGSRAPAGRGASGAPAAPSAGSRNSLAGSSSTRSTGPIVRWSAGSNARSESISSPKNSIRTGSGSPAGTRRRCRRAGRTRRGRRPRRPARSRGRAARAGARPGGAGRRARAPAARRAGPPGRSVCWRSAWTLATRIRARPAAPGGERRDAGGRLVGDELAALVGQRGPRLEHGDGAGIAEPRPELLRDAIADLGVAGDPDQPLAAVGQREGRREVALRAVRHRRRGRRAGRRLGDVVVGAAEPLAQVANEPVAASSGGSAERSGSRWPRREAVRGRRRVPAGRRRCAPLAPSAARPRRLRRARPRLAVGVLDLASTSATSKSTARRSSPAHGGPRTRSRRARRSGAPAALAAQRRRCSARGVRLGRAHPRQPVFVRRTPSASGRPVDLARRRRSRSSSAAPQLEGVAPVGRLVRALARPGLDGVGGRVEQFIQPLPLVGREPLRTWSDRCRDPARRCRPGVG